MTSQDDSTWGDFVDSDGEIDVEDSCEPVDRYEEGLYYPICIGEVLARRYRIEHKLGHGGFSTVWMAYDVSEEKHVAMKILTGDRAGEREYDVQKDVISAVRDQSHLLTYIDTFVLPGTANFRHRVLVFPLRGPNLETFAPSRASPQHEPKSCLRYMELYAHLCRTLPGISCLLWCEICLHRV